MLAVKTTGIILKEMSDKVLKFIYCVDTPAEQQYFSSHLENSWISDDYDHFYWERRCNSLKNRLRG